LGTLPVFSATNEKIFSNLKRLKTYLRNSISEVPTLYTLKNIFGIYNKLNI